MIGGKNKHSFRFVNAYMPCDNTKGTTTVFRQHRLHLQSQGDERLPRQAMLEDFHQTLSAWLEAGEIVMVFMDANDDVRQGEVNTMFRSLEMREMISKRHGKTHPMPATQQRNTASRPIDGVWSNVPNSLRCGYLAFGEGVPGDHRTMWIDIPFATMFGYTPPHIHKVYPPDLTTADPRIRKRYNQRVRRLLTKWGTFLAVKQLRQMVTNSGCKMEMRQLHHKITRHRHRAGELAAKGIRKKCTGAIPWSPGMQKLFDIRTVWRRVVLKRKKLNVGSKQIRRLANKHGIKEAFEVDLETAEAKLNSAILAVKKGKKEARKQRQQHLFRLAQALAKTKKTQAKGELKGLRARERQREKWRRIAVL